MSQGRRSGGEGSVGTHPRVEILQAGVSVMQPVIYGLVAAARGIDLLENETLDTLDWCAADWPVVRSVITFPSP